jgi:arylsulfatase A-like enzyme
MLLTGCGGEPRRPNLLLITLDTLRADRLGCYGNTNGLTPELDALAADGIRFERAYTPVPLTLPAHASILTGLFPPEHRLRTNFERALAPDVPTLAELLRNEGYKTGAFIAAYVLNGGFGLDRGFDVYDDEFDVSVGGLDEKNRYRQGAYVIDAAQEWLDTSADERPFFCWVHLYDPHIPYHSHRTLFGERYEKAPYDAEVAYTDRQVGRLVHWLARNNVFSNTWIIAVADHGEGLGEHNENTHGYMVYETTMHVPLIIRPPSGVPEALQFSTPVSLVDLMPTVLDLLDMPTTHDGLGRSLAAALSGEALPAWPCFGESELGYRVHGWAPLRMLVDEHWKLIQTPTPELYNLADDPNELHNVHADYPQKAQALFETARQIEASMVPQTAQAKTLTPEDHQALESLGYLTGNGSATEIKTAYTLPDVKDRIDLLNRFNEANKRRLEGDPDTAVAMLETVVEAAPEDPAFRRSLATALGGAGQTDEALAQIDALIEANPDDLQSYIEAGRILLAADREDEARRYLETAEQRARQDPVVSRLLDRIRNAP